MWAREGNKYLQDKAPWLLARDEAAQQANQQLIDNTIFMCLQLTANLAIFLNPFLPATARKICYLLKVVDRMLEWENAGSLKLLSVGYSLRAPELLFRKIEDAEIEKQIQKLQSGGQQPQPNISASSQPQKESSSSAKPIINFEDFDKIDLRVGTIIAAEKVQKADKLLQLTVDLGNEQRTIVSGIAQHYAPEEIIGQQVVVVANLAPRKLKGITSQGMILMAEDQQGKLHFIAPSAIISPGGKVS